MASMVTTVQGCKFCDIVAHQKDKHLLDSDKAVVIRDIKPKAPHHLLVLTKVHINKPTDLTATDIPLLEAMEKLGRECLRYELKSKGEADIVEDMLRVGFHWPPMISVNHVHLHVIYPIKDLGFFSRLLTFRPGKVFKEVGDVINDLREKHGIPDPLAGNPAANDNPEAVSAHAVT